MSWFSLLPKSLVIIETWLIRIFFVLGVVCIAPWLLLIAYDAVFYIFRVSTYEIPVIGGRARNRPRPRAPSLSERPSGRPRTFSVAIPGLATATEGAAEAVGDIKKRIERPGHSVHASEAIADE